MWLFTKTGFYSVVQHRDLPDFFLVRGRVRNDLEALIKAIPEYGDELIRHQPDGDYAWSVPVGKLLFTEWMSNNLYEIDYTTGVKDEIDQDDPKRHKALYDVWDAMMSLQEGGAYNYKRPDLDAEWEDVWND